MTKKTFIAQQWLQKSPESSQDSRAYFNPTESKSSCKMTNRFPHFINRSLATHSPRVDHSKFHPVDYFVPGWKGESLPSKSVMRFENLLKKVQEDIKAELLKEQEFPRKIKMGIHNEFLSFAGSLGLHLEGLDDLSRFWSFLSPETISKEKHVSDFIDIYSARVATITFLKLRFIAALIEKCGMELNERALLYPTSFLSQIFKQGSATELNSKALESNLFSWYRPHEQMKLTMKELLHLSRELEITQIIKNVSKTTQTEQEKDKVYSHALSHLSFGLFLNSLQINFPLWVETIEGKLPPLHSLEQEEIISCKYFGDYLESLSLSHWLAQENNMSFKWDQILCPDFKGVEFISGLFTKLCNELQFLTFLAIKSEHQGERPIDYICKVMSGHYQNRKMTKLAQRVLLEDNPFYSSTYDRVVLNLCHFPKNNPQHYLMAQIQDQVRFLKTDGYLFVSSHKKLFVPSLRDRITPLLRELKLEAIFDLENIKGKGEIGSYIYVFRKQSSLNSVTKQICSYFRISADLNSFQEFSSLSEHLRSFYLSHLVTVPPMSQSDYLNKFRIEYYQDALVNGMLIHSSTEDSTRITHPTFFRNLLNNYIPLDSLFEIKSLALKEGTGLQENSLNIALEKDLSYFLLVDFRKKEVNLELHPVDTFRAIHSEYGEVLCSYFKLHPKRSGLNPNILRNYFETPIGKQVINLTFSRGPSLVKGSLTKLLVPKCMTELELLPAQLKPAFEIFEKEEAQLLESSPQILLKSFIHADQIVHDLLPKYSSQIVSYYSNLERCLESLIKKMDSGQVENLISFNNPMIQTQLTKKPTNPIYPENNKEVYLELIDGSSPVDLLLPLTQSQIRFNYEADLKLCWLELISNDRVIVRLHAEEIIIQFISFLLTHATNYPISKILKAINIPSLEHLREVLDTTKNMKNIYEDLLQKIKNSISIAFRISLDPQKKSP